MARHNNAKGIAWIALVVALIALIFAWIAFTRTGSNIEERVRQEVRRINRTVNESQASPTSTSSDQSSQTATSSIDTGTTTTER